MDSAPYQTRTDFRCLKGTDANPYTNGADFSDQSSARTHGFEPRVEVLEASTAPRQSSALERVEADLNCCCDIFSVECCQVTPSTLKSAWRDSNSRFQHGELACYRYTTGALQHAHIYRRTIGTARTRTATDLVKSEACCHNTSVPWHLLSCQTSTRRHSVRRESINQESNLSRHITSVQHCHCAIDAAFFNQ